MPLIELFDAQRLAASEEVAVAPITFDAQPVSAGKGGADAVVAQLAFADLDLDRDLAAGVALRLLRHRDAGEDAERHQPVARLFHLPQRILPAFLEPGHVGGEARVHGLGAGDRRRP